MAFLWWETYWFGIGLSWLRKQFFFSMWIDVKCGIRRASKCETWNKYKIDWVKQLRHSKKYANDECFIFYRTYCMVDIRLYLKPSDTCRFCSEWVSMLCFSIDQISLFHTFVPFFFRNANADAGAAVVLFKWLSHVPKATWYAKRLRYLI